mgnify:CR=1 FL=1
MGLGCRAREQADSLQPAVVEPVQRVTHRSVADPPQVEGHEPVLWVALEDHLGAAETAAPLHLSAFKIGMLEWKFTTLPSKEPGCHN